MKNKEVDHHFFFCYNYIGEIMSKNRSKLREKIMIILYQNEILAKTDKQIDINKIIKDNVEIDSEFVKDIVYGVITHKEEIDGIANEKLVDWKINRIDLTGASILRMAIFELLYTDTPDIVVINEAVELAKKYSDDAVFKIINAVLDKLINDEK